MNFGFFKLFNYLEVGSYYKREHIQLYTFEYASAANMETTMYAWRYRIFLSRKDVFSGFFLSGKDIQLVDGAALASAQPRADALLVENVGTRQTAQKLAPLEISQTYRTAIGFFFLVLAFLLYLLLPRRRR